MRMYAVTAGTTSLTHAARGPGETTAEGIVACGGWSDDHIDRCCPILTGRFSSFADQTRAQAGDDRRASNSSPPVQRRPLLSIYAGRRLVLVRLYRCGTARV